MVMATVTENRVEEPNPSQLFCRKSLPCQLVKNQNSTNEGTCLCDETLMALSCWHTDMKSKFDLTIDFAEHLYDPKCTRGATGTAIELVLEGIISPSTTFGRQFQYRGLPQDVHESIW